MQQEWQKKVWQLEDVQRYWSELVVEADRWPQRVAGPGGDVYIISADLHRRFFDRGIRFDGDEWAELDGDPPSAE
ncbi:MAG TPA: hypothetical protein VGC13_24565 [Longimicrobium sp.]|jgi:hypothetical protein|uniref:hypothetical protein n=1 Tax=Longimicrobium sp. TaxID=2029185 RepID=UPI002ED9ED95